MTQLPATPKKVESRPLERRDVEESSMSFESSEEEGEPNHEPEPPELEPYLVRRSTRQRKPPERYGYSPNDWRCIFALNANIDELISIQEALGMDDLVLENSNG